MKRLTDICIIKAHPSIDSLQKLGNLDHTTGNSTNMLEQVLPK